MRSWAGKLALVLLAWPLLATRGNFAAQGTAGEPARAAGSVSGRVLCADTQRPARFAQVHLEPVPDGKGPGVAGAIHGLPGPEWLPQTVTTELDGSFHLVKVPPGRYYLFAEQEGYLSVLQRFLMEELQRGDQGLRQRVADLVPAITVVAGGNTHVDLQLTRGAAIAGAVRFDDGSPAIAVPVNLMQRDAAGRWVPVQAGLTGLGGEGRTDDHGAYRIAGLLPGDYLLSTSLVIDAIEREPVLQGGSSGSVQERYRLTFFQEGAARTKDAKPIHVEEGGEVAGADIEIPSTKLHSLGGEVVVAGTAHPVDEALVALAWADDPETIVVTAPQENNRFRFPFVLEGSYVVKVLLAQDVRRTEVLNCATCTPQTHVDEETLRRYGPVLTPVRVMSDQTDLVVSVPLISNDADVGNDP